MALEMRQWHTDLIKVCRSWELKHKHNTTLCMDEKSEVMGGFQVMGDGRKANGWVLCTLSGCQQWPQSNF